MGHLSKKKRTKKKQNPRNFFLAEKEWKIILGHFHIGAGLEFLRLLHDQDNLPISRFAILPSPITQISNKFKQEKLPYRIVSLPRDSGKVYLKRIEIENN